MNGKKSKRKSPATRRDAAPPSPGDADVVSSDAIGPSPRVKSLLSIWVAFQLSALVISFTSVVEPSTIQAQVSGLLDPYLLPTHFSADDRPVYLTHGDTSEQPHLLQVTRDSVPSIDRVDSHTWTTVGPPHYPGLAAGDRLERWLSTAAMLSENEQSGLVAELLLPIVEHQTAAKAIRIVRLPTDLSDVSAEAESPYVARVVRAGNRVSLVQLNQTRLSSQAIARTGDGEQ